jgi:hypothetical protein
MIETDHLLPAQILRISLSASARDSAIATFFCDRRISPVCIRRNRVAASRRNQQAGSPIRLAQGKLCAPQMICRNRGDLKSCDYG